MQPRTLKRLEYEKSLATGPREQQRKARLQVWHDNEVTFIKAGVPMLLATDAGVIQPDRLASMTEKQLEQYTIAHRQNPQHENSLFNQIGLFIEVMHDPIRAIPVCEEFIRRFPSSDKTARVKQQLQELKSL